MPPLDKAHQLERRARTIVESLQGTWSRGKGMCCCPAHDDRTLSLSVALGRRAILFHCFAGCPNEAVIAALDRQGVRSRDLFNASDAETIERQRYGDFSPNARRLWQSAATISDSPALQYLANRGLLRGSDQLRYLARTPLGPRGAVRFLPAMLAAVTIDIGVIAVHRTFIDLASGKLAAFERPKRALGTLGCGAVRLAPPVQGRLGLAEGIESALSAMQLFDIPCWATLGNERFGLVAIPESVGELHLFIDNDAGGALAEQRALKAYAAPHRVIHSRAPASPGFDWNHELLAAREFHGPARRQDGLDDVFGGKRLLAFQTQRPAQFRNTMGGNLAGREQLMVKRSLVNGSQRIELTGWSVARLDWYKAQGCFTVIIRYQTRLFVPIEGAASVIARLASSA